MWERIERGLFEPHQMELVPAGFIPDWVPARTRAPGRRGRAPSRAGLPNAYRRIGHTPPITCRPITLQKFVSEIFNFTFVWQTFDKDAESEVSAAAKVLYAPY